MNEQCFEKARFGFCRSDRGSWIGESDLKVLQLLNVEVLLRLGEQGDGDQRKVDSF